MSQSDMHAAKARLMNLYREVSKHAAYQTIPDFVSTELGYVEAIDSNWRGDRNRLAYILSVLTPAAGQTWADFGANTGFFTYTLARSFASTRFLAIEANAQHAQFLQEIKTLFAVDNVEVRGQAVALDDLPSLPAVDVMLHLNVLHHAGADFDQKYVSGEHDFADYAVRYLRQLRASVGALVFQVGSNLWGNKAHPLVEMTDDVGKLVYVAHLIRQAGWKIAHLAYPHAPANGEVVYADVDAALITLLNDGNAQPSQIAAALAPFNLPAHVGEFYRRALFVLVRD